MTAHEVVCVHRGFTVYTVSGFYWAPALGNHRHYRRLSSVKRAIDLSIKLNK
jgi:hypothetical protein